MADPKGKILKPDGTDVSNRDRSDDGAIILRRGVEKGHNYKFSMPSMPWKFCECPKCHGSGASFVSALDGDFIICNLCNGEREIMVWRANEWLRSQDAQETD